jgi:alkylglycerol monooxygenase
MDAGSQLLQAAVPFFLVLLILELFIDRRRGTGYYRRAAAWSDLATGTVSQVCDLLLKAACLPAYVLVYEHARLFDLAGRPLLHWCVGLLGVDFLYYFWHRAGHEIRLMWAVHSVHHQSEDMNLAVALRQPALQAPSVVLFFLPLALVGVDPRVVMLAYTFNLIYQFGIHTELVRTLGPLEWILNTPSHHRVHHGRNPQYLDKNYGGVLIVWDRMFGSFAPEVERPVYGITKQLGSFNPIWANCVEFVWLWRTTRTQRGWRAWLGLWFGHPGSLADETELQPTAASEKYQGPATTVSQPYVIFQAVLLFLVLNSAFLFVAHASPRSPVAIAWAALAVLWSAAALLGLVERRPWTARSERVRVPFLVIGAGVAAGLLAGPAAAFAALAVAALLFGAPFVWLLVKRGRVLSAVSRSEHPA